MIIHSNKHAFILLKSSLRKYNSIRKTGDSNVRNLFVRTTLPPRVYKTRRKLAQFRNCSISEIHSKLGLSHQSFMHLNQVMLANKQKKSLHSNKRESLSFNSWDYKHCSKNILSFSTTGRGTIQIYCLGNKVRISYHLYVAFFLKKLIQMSLFTTENQIHRLQKQTYGYQGGRGDR